MGAEYERTRHNIGFDVLNKLALRQNVDFKNDQLGDIAEFKYKSRSIFLLKPSTYMNLSGKAVRYWIQKLRINEDQWLVVVDEFQFDIGVMKLQKKGSAGGHNGLKSIEQTMQTSAYPRLRIGIGHDFFRGQQVDYVLGKWTAEEWTEMQPVMESAGDAILSFATIGMDRTMNGFNKKNLVDPGKS